MTTPSPEPRMPKPQITNVLLNAATHLNRIDLSSLCNVQGRHEEALSIVPISARTLVAYPDLAVEVMGGVLQTVLVGPPAHCSAMADTAMKMDQSSEARQRGGMK